MGSITTYFVNSFYRRWAQRCGASYPPARRKHNAIFSRLLKTYTPEMLERYLDFYFSEPFASYSVEHFYSALPYVVGEVGKREKEREAYEQKENERQNALERAQVSKLRTPFDR